MKFSRIAVPTLLIAVAFATGASVNAQCSTGRCPRQSAAPVYSYRAPATAYYYYPQPVQAPAPTVTYRESVRYSQPAQTYTAKTYYRGPAYPPAAPTGAPSCTNCGCSMSAPKAPAKASPQSLNYPPAAPVPGVVGRPVQAAQVQSAPAPVQVAAPVQVQVTYGDSYGFGGWLNNLRARVGLHALRHNPALDYDASVNNQQQHSRGMGHFHMGAARRQNAGWGAGAQVWPMWISSRDHYVALVDPSVTEYGIAASGPWWTYCAR